MMVLSSFTDTTWLKHAEALIDHLSRAINDITAVQEDARNFSAWEAHSKTADRIATVISCSKFRLRAIAVAMESEGAESLRKIDCARLARDSRQVQSDLQLVPLMAIQEATTASSLEQTLHAKSHLFADASELIRDST